LSPNGPSFEPPGRGSVEPAGDADLLDQTVLAGLARAVPADQIDGLLASVVAESQGMLLRLSDKGISQQAADAIAHEFSGMLANFGLRAASQAIGKVETLTPTSAAYDHALARATAELERSVQAAKHFLNAAS